MSTLASLTLRPNDLTAMQTKRFFETVRRVTITTCPHGVLQVQIERDQAHKAAPAPFWRQAFAGTTILVSLEPVKESSGRVLHGAVLEYRVLPKELEFGPSRFKFKIAPSEQARETMAAVIGDRALGEVIPEIGRITLGLATAAVMLRTNLLERALSRQTHQL